MFDGLVCLFFPDHSGFVVNPTTRWHRVLPLTNYQQRLIIDTREERFVHSYFGLGFGKDKFTCTFKPVWLYNSSEIGLKDGTTTCEVFDFSTDAWRYVIPSAPYEVTGHDPAYLDGSLYYFTNCLETKILSFDLHTEAFQVVAKAPFSCVSTDKYKMVIGNLDNRLYLSNNLKWSNQDIWLFNSSNKTWDKMYSIDMDKTLMKLGIKVRLPVAPISLLDGEKKKKKKKKLLYCGRGQYRGQTLAIHDPETQSYDVAFTADSIGYPVCYFQIFLRLKFSNL